MIVKFFMLLGLIISMVYCLKGLAFLLSFFYSLWFKGMFDHKALTKSVFYIGVVLLFLFFCVNSGLLKMIPPK